MMRSIICPVGVCDDDVQIPFGERNLQKHEIPSCAGIGAFERHPLPRIDLERAQDGRSEMLASPAEFRRSKEPIGVELLGEELCLVEF